MTKTFALLCSFGLLCSLALLGLASGDNTSATFDIAASGDAQMAITDNVDLFFDSAVMTAAVGPDNALTFSGTIRDSTFGPDPDYTLSINSNESGASGSFELKGGTLVDLVGIFGNFKANASIANSNGALSLSLNAVVPRSTLEYLFGVNTTEIQQDASQLRSDIEQTLNDQLSTLSITPKPTVSISSFQMSGDEVLTIRLNVLITGWNGFAKAVASASSMQDTDQGLAECLGLSSADTVSSLLGSDFSAVASVTGSGNSVSGSMTVASAAPLASAGIRSMDASVAKSNETVTLSGSASLADASTFVSCLMKDYLPGEYGAEGFHYSLSGSIDGTVQTLDGSLTSFARKSNGNWVVSFPSGVTSNMSITVNTPSSMSILSVDGGQKTGPQSAVSSPGQDFTVTYGQKGADYTMWIIAAVVIVVIILLASRRKK